MISNHSARAISSERELRVADTQQRAGNKLPKIGLGSPLYGKWMSTLRAYLITNLGRIVDDCWERRQWQIFRFVRNRDLDIPDVGDSVFCVASSPLVCPVKTYIKSFGRRLFDMSSTAFFHIDEYSTTQDPFCIPCIRFNCSENAPGRDHWRRIRRKLIQPLLLTYQMGGS